MDRKQRERIDDLTRNLKPSSVKMKLISAGVFLLAYEMLKSSVVDKLRDRYAIIPPGGKETDASIYNKEVLALDDKQRPFAASVNWYANQKVISDSEAERLHEIRCHRDYIAHETPERLFHGVQVNEAELLERLYEVLSKIDRWWIFDHEIPMIDELTDREFTEDDHRNTMSSNMAVLSLMIPVAGGDDGQLEELYESLVARKGKSRQGKF